VIIDDPNAPLGKTFTDPSAYGKSRRDDES